MKKISILVLILLTIKLVYSQEEINKIIFDEMADENILFGYCNTNGFIGDDFSYWYNDEFDHYQLDEASLELIDPELFSEVNIKIVIGTWCGDSQRELPRLIKILAHLSYNLDDLTIIGVDKNKTAEGTEVDILNIEFVPTIIFSFDGEEIGRIIESPVESLEKDLVEFISAI